MLWIVVLGFVALGYLLAYALCKAAGKEERILENSSIEDVFGHREEKAN